jgi:hypothetical protein
MPKKKRPETPEEQATRFKREAQRLADAGLLTLTEGECELDAFVRHGAGGKNGSQMANKE